MVLPIFYHDGWNLRINNQEVPITNTNNSMIGFKLPDTDDLIIGLNYTETGFLLSIIITVFFIGIFIIFNKRSRRSLNNKLRYRYN